MRNEPLDAADVVLIAAAAAVFVLACLWLALTVGGVLAGSDLATTDLADLLGAATRLVTAPLASAPLFTGGPPAWATSALTAVLAASPGLGLLTRSGRQQTDRFIDLATGRSTRGARWARGSDLAPLTVAGPTRGRLVLGRAGRRILATEERHSVIVFGPTGSFKTSGLAIPAIRNWDGPVLCASVKNDLLRHTVERREQCGDVMVFDPTGSTGLPSDGWSPLGQCSTWHGALRVSQWLCTATHTGGSGGDLDFWYRAAKKLLAPLLFAAATSGRSMADVVRWVDLQTGDEVDAALRLAHCEEASDAWAARELRDPKQRSSIYTTLETVLDAYQDPRVLRDAERDGITRGHLIDGGHHSLYLCSPADDQDALRSVFSTLILSITTAVYEKVNATGVSLDPPLLLVLDELANVAPVPRLDVLASTGRDQGIQQLSILQDFSQLEERYGPKRARTIVNNHHAKLVLSGQSDHTTLELTSQLLGDQELEQVSTAKSEGRTTRTASTTFRRLAPEYLSREQRGGHGILVYGNLPAARVVLQPHFET